MNDMAKNLILWTIIAAVLLMVFQNLNVKAPVDQLNYSEFVHQVQSGQVSKVVIDGLDIDGENRNGEPFKTVILNILRNWLVRNTSKRTNHAVNRK